MKKQLAKQQRGFAVMSQKDKVRIATMGGRAVHEQHGSEHMAKIGHIGGIVPRVRSRK